MTKKLILFFFLLGIVLHPALSQFQVKGRVISEEDGLEIPGVYVLEKETENHTLTDKNGNFSLTVSKPSATLVFAFIGMITQEYAWQGEETVEIKMEENVIRCYFDTQQITLYAKSGVIHTPIGGAIDISLPAYFGPGTLSTGAGFQTNLKGNDFFTAQIAYDHFAWFNNVGMDAKWNFRKINFGEYFKSYTHSLETHFRLNSMKVVAGVSQLEFNDLNDQPAQSLTGPVIGFGVWTGRRLRLEIEGKAAIYKGKTEYLAQITRGFRHIDLFAKYYHLDAFNELSIGIGTSFYY